MPYVLDHVRRVVDPEPPPIGRALWEVLTGAAGSGKSWASREYVRTHDDAILASSTGISAVNLGGEATTINALLGYFDEDSLRDKIVAGRVQGMLRSLRKAGIRRIILDEISMISGGTLDLLVYAIQEVNNDLDVVQHPEDQIGMTLVGDFCQLPPVQGAYAFEAGCWNDRFAPNIHKLTRIWRQEDPAFVEALRAARRADVPAVVDFFGPHAQLTTLNDFEGTTVFGTNAEVARWNDFQHLKLRTQPIKFATKRSGQQKPEWKAPNPNGRGGGQIPDTFEIKPGARVMILANEHDRENGGLVYSNGDLGTFEGITEQEMEVGGEWKVVNMAVVRLMRNGEQVGVPEVTRLWETPSGALGVKKPKMEILGRVTYMPIRLAYASSVHKCLLAGTRVPVVGRGLLPVEDVHVGDIVLSGRGHQCRVIAAQPTGMKELVIVKFASGRELSMSPDHPLFDGATFVVGATVGQRVQIGRDFDHETTWDVPLPSYIPTPRGAKTTTTPTAMSAALAWWLGAVLGDGSIRDWRDGTIEFHAREATLVEAFVDYARGLFNVEARRYPKKVYVISKAVREWLARLGLHYVTGESKVVPECIMRAPTAIRGHFLAGLFDTDGCVDARGLRYVTTSRRLAMQVQQLLDSLGVTETRISSQVPTFTYRGAKRQGLRAYTVRVARKGLEQLHRRVRLLHVTKASRLAAHVLKPVKELPVNADHGKFDTIVEVRKTGLHVPLHDLEVEDDHSFIANGLVVSNTQGLSMDNVQIAIAHKFFAAPAMLYVALSRARSMKGLRLVGTPQLIANRCTVDPKVKEWL